MLSSSISYWHYGLLSEAVSVLNGAHLGANNRLSKLLRDCRQKARHASSSENKDDGYKMELQSAAIEAIGISSLSRHQLSVMSHPNCLPVAPTVADIIAPVRGHLRASCRFGLHTRFTPRRRFHVHAHTLLSQVKSPHLLSQLETRANLETDNPKVQAKYLEAVVSEDPHYVIRRFESGKFAVNYEVRQVYQQALKLTEEIDAQAEGMFSPKFNIDSSDVGSKLNPMHVVMQPKKGGYLRELWYLARFLIAAFFVTTLISSALFSQMKGGAQQITKDFKPDKKEQKYSFKDVQGIDEAKAEVQEIVCFLKDPEKFKSLGARLPTGILLVGPPGTGKTLLAKAIAGEAEVPFFFASGSEFDEMFVGVGASRVRKLFEQARRNKPCVVFIDELDAVGGTRVASAVHPYSRMTLNQLLVELDGYKELEGVVVVGATNFPESLDKALIRPGRFDTRVHITLPDVLARYNILKVHASKIKLSPEVDLEKIARVTPGLSGADLANLINQAALRGSVEGKNEVSYDELEYAKDRIIMGPERKSAVIEKKNQERVAYHEGGHAIVALFTEGSMPVYKATIVPRGASLGMVSLLPEKDELSWTKKQLLAQIDVSMGGRVAEEIIFGIENVTTGASQDLQNATRIATAMVTKYAMSDAVGLVSHDDKASPATQKLIDDEIKLILKESYNRAKALLEKRATEHKRLAEGLLKYETLSAKEIDLVIAAKSLERKL